MLSSMTNEEYEEQYLAYNELHTAYEEKATEADQYYQDLVKAKANEDKGLGGMIGAGAIYDPTDSTFDITAEVGIEYNKLSLSVGVIYPYELIESFDMDNMRYTAGLNLRF